MPKNATVKELTDKARQLVRKYRQTAGVKSFGVLFGFGEKKKWIGASCYYPLPADVQDRIRADAAPVHVEFTSAECDTCHGTRQKTCPSCLGTGGHKVCSNCGGTGDAPFAPGTCSVCDAVASESWCPLCHGEKTVPCHCVA